LAELSPQIPTARSRACASSRAAVSAGRLTVSRHKTQSAKVAIPTF